MDNQKPARRKRYSGKYPKHFELKYKEKQPDKYQDLITHVIEKGNTPAGMHRSIMVDEIMSFLDIKENQIGLDATLGYGGHSRVILEKLNHTGHLDGVDIDPIELPKTNQRLRDFGFSDQDYTLHHLNFEDIDLIEKTFDFMIADLGVSSMQMDDPTRGFTYKYEGPLDLRMNPKQGIPASERLKTLSEDEIIGMLIENADEIYAKEIAAEIIKSRSAGHRIETTKDLHQIIQSALKNVSKKERDDIIKKASQRTFQALRIDINHEYEALFNFLEKIPALLNSDGKVCILTFHSGEDRLVKKAFQHYQRLGVYREIVGPILPTLDEISKNSRARSAKLRCAIK